MSRADLARARQLVRLRDLTLDAALRRLADANDGLAAAEARVAEALAVRDAAIATHAGARAALVEEPGDAAMRLARIALTADRETAATTAADEAEDLRRAAEDEVIAARLDVRRARARSDAMTGRADQLNRLVLRADEARESIEVEEGVAAMRTAA